jgi:hypothetical protein
MHSTPFFPPWRPRLAALGRRCGRLRASTLSQLEQTLGCFLPSDLLAPAPQGQNSRQRVFSLNRTVWCFVWQVLDPNRCCRSVVRQVQALFQLKQGLSVDEDTSAYCQARKRLALERLQSAWQAAAAKAQGLTEGWGTLASRPVKVVDGSTLLLADTPKNRKLYPQTARQKRGCGFPLFKFVVLFCLGSGAILDLVYGNKYQSERRLFARLWDHLKANDIVLSDRGFGDYPSAAGLQVRGIDLVARMHQSRKVDFRKGQSLGPQDGLFVWKKSVHPSAYISKRAWRKLPDTLTVRLVRFKVSKPGFRPEKITLVTTLLDAKVYTAQALAQLFLRRWRLELCLDDLKTTLRMEHLRTQSPDMVHRELAAFLLAHNLIRCLMAEAARTHSVELTRLSFKGTIDSVDAFSNAIAQARQPWRKRRLRTRLLEVIAADLVPLRTGRREPRVRKRRPKDYPLMNLPRAVYHRHFKNNRGFIAKNR